MEFVETEIYHNYLLSLGNAYSLDIGFDIGQMTRELVPYAEDWHPYNSRKEIKRYGLSLTSLDGGMSGVPDLDSVRDYNRLNGTEYDEADFNVPTEAFKNSASLWEPLSGLKSFLGRSHLIRLDEGGYFPPHRDEISFGARCFRLFSPLKNCNHDSFVFLLNGERLWLQKGTLFFINTRLSHSVYSFADNAQMLVLNVLANVDSLNYVRKNLLHQ